MNLPFPEPSGPVPTALGYLDYFRSVLITNVQGLPDDELRGSRLP